MLEDLAHQLLLCGVLRPSLLMPVRKSRAQMLAVQICVVDSEPWGRRLVSSDALRVSGGWETQLL